MRPRRVMSKNQPLRSFAPRDSRGRLSLRRQMRLPLFNYSAFRRFDEPDEHLDVFAEIGFGLQLFDRLRRIQFGSEQHSICMMNFPDARFRESPPLQTHGVQSIGAGSALGGCFRKRQHIPRYGCSPTYKGMRPNPDEMV